MLKSHFTILTERHFQKGRDFPKYRVGLALSGGVAYGMAQIGVLKVLEKAGITVDCVAGTSAGAIIAAAFAAGLPPSRIEAIGLDTNWGDLFRVRPSRKGLVSSEPIEEYIRRHLPVNSFEALEKPLAVVATDICSGEEVVFTRGPLDRAVRASCSIPGIYSPVEVEGRQLVDGGMSENVPVRALKSLGAEVVIAVNVLGSKTYFRPVTNVFQVLMRVWYFFVQRSVFWRDTADVILEPELKAFDLFNFGDGPGIIAAGEKEARKKLREIRQVLQRRFYFRPEIYR